MTIEVSDPAALAPAIREAVQRTDAALPAIDTETERQQIAETIRGPRAVALVTTVSRVIGLLLACVGLYGIVPKTLCAGHTRSGSEWPSAQVAPRSFVS